MERSQDKRMQLRDGKIKEYFYGIQNTFRPHAFDVEFSAVKLFKIGGMLTLLCFHADYDGIFLYARMNGMKVSILFLLTSPQLVVKSNPCFTGSFDVACHLCF